MSKLNKGLRTRRAKWVSSFGWAAGGMLLATPYFAHAATTVTWIGGTGNFGDSSQWLAGATNIVPGAGSVTMIGNNGVVSIAGGNFTGIGTLNLGYNFTGAGAPGTGQLLVDSGAISFASDINIGVGSDGKVVIGGGANPAVFATSASNKNFLLGAGPLNNTTGGNAEIDILNNGTLQILNHSGVTANTASYAGASTINMSGGSLTFPDLNNGNILSPKNLIFTAGTIVNLAAGTFTQLSGDNTAAIIGNNSSTPVGIIVDQSVDTTYDGMMGAPAAGGNGRFTKNGSGVLSLGPDAVVNTKSSMTFNNGTVRVNKDNTFDPGSIIFGGGTLDLNGHSQTGSFLTGNGSLLLGDGGAFTVGFSSSSTATFTGQIVGTGNASFTKTGSGLLILTGSQNYSGATNISNGTIALTASGNNPLATSSLIAQTASGANIDVTALSGGLILNASNNQTLQMAGGKFWGNLTVGAGTTLKGNGTINGNTTISGTVDTNGSVGVLNTSALSLSNATINAEISSSSADRLVVLNSDALSLNGTSNITLTDLGGTKAGTYALFTYSGTPLTDQGHLALQTSSVNGFPATLRYNVSSANSIDLELGSFWNFSGDGNVSESAKWDGGTPNGVGAAAFLGFLGGSVSAPAITVTLDQPTTLGTLQFSNTFPAYTVAGSPTNNLTFAASSGNATITVLAGSHTISAPVVLTGDTTVNATGSIAFTGNVTATGHTITKSGAGLAQFENIQALGLNVTNGTVAIRAKAGPDSTAGTSIVNSLTIASAKTLDLTNNALIIPYSSLGSILDDMRQELSDGRLTTSLSAGGHALGYADNTVLGKSTFGGQTVDASNVLIGYTFTGDANLDGVVNALDFNAIATNFGSGGKYWTDGDVTYDGNVNTDDFVALASNFGQSLGVSPGPGLASLVPEPVALMAAPILGLMLRRRRLHK